MGYAKIPVIYNAKMRKSSPRRPCTENPRSGGRGRGSGDEYPSERPPEPQAVGCVGSARYSAAVWWHGVRPFSREGGVNQRWYRVLTPSVRKDRGRFFRLKEGERSMSKSLRCPHCGTEMLFVGKKDFQLGDMRTFDMVRGFPDGPFPMEVYGCPSCRKLEFFSAEPICDDLECPVCHAKYPRTAERCPKCFTKWEK